MNRRFVKHLRIVAVCHLGVLVIMLTTSGWTGIFERKSDSSPVMEFVVAVPGDPIPNVKVYVADPVKDPVKEQVKAAEETSVESIKNDQGGRKKIEKSNKKIVRQVDKSRGGGGAQKTNMTAQEINRFLAMGAKAGDHTFIPDDEEARCRAIIKNTMDEAWNQPSREDAGDSVAEVTIGLSRDGRVTWRKLSKKSGNALFDESVVQAVDSVQAIEHLTPSFLEKFREVKVSFKLE